LETSLTLATHLAPATVYPARDWFKQLAPELRSRKLRDLRPAIFATVYAELTAAGKAPGTIRYLHRELWARLNHAVKLGKLGRSPLVGVQLPRLEHVERRTLSGPEVATLLGGTETHRPAAQVARCGATVHDRTAAARVSDVAGLRPPAHLRFFVAPRWVPATVAAERLGHSSIVLTLNAYSQVTPTMQADANERLSRSVSRLASGSFVHSRSAPDWWGSTDP
jgi:hypothetical protein